MKKAGRRRGQAAFAHIGLTWVSELAIHHPIAAAIGELQGLWLVIDHTYFPKGIVVKRMG